MGSREGLYPEDDTDLEREMPGTANKETDWSTAAGAAVI